MRRRRLPQEQSEARAHDVHGGTAPGATGQFSTGLEPGRTGPGANRADHGTEQACDAGVVPKLQGPTEKAYAHGEGQEPT